MSKQDENPRRALGKGLHSLLPNRPHASERPESIEGGHATSDSLPVSQIKPNPYQPRRTFSAPALEELAASIRAEGVIQPIVVRKAGSEYQIVAGERRWRAAQLAGLTKVPVSLQDIPDERLLEIALIENIQREDLNPIEQANAFQRLAEELNLNQEEIGRRTGKDRATISNAIRLLQLPEDLQQMIADRKISPGHARALLKISAAEQQRIMAQRIVNEGWSVRQIEQATQDSVTRPKKDAQPPRPLDPNVKAAIEEMERALGTRVRIVEAPKGGGRIEIEYYSPEDLDRIYTTIATPAE